MIKFGKPVFHKTFALALAAAMAVTAAGCSGTAHTTSAPSDAPQAATEAAAVPTAPSADAAKDSGTSAAAEIAEPEDTTAATAAAAEADTAAAASTAAETADSSDTSAETAAADATSSTAEAAAADPEDSAAEAIKDGVPERDKADTALQESVLSEALVECTGWGQSAGSSLRAATASVMLLQWANAADAANADPTLLANTVKDEVNRLSDAQKENLKANWSSISFDASMILDSFDEISMILDDAGCADAAKEISGNKQSVANWEALEHALDAVLK